jgi:hypothetical protein
MEDTLALGHTYLDVLDEENDGNDGHNYPHSRYLGANNTQRRPKSLEIAYSIIARDFHSYASIANNCCDPVRLGNSVALAT